MLYTARALKECGFNVILFTYGVIDHVDLPYLLKMLGSEFKEIIDSRIEIGIERELLELIRTFFFGLGNEHQETTPSRSPYILTTLRKIRIPRRLLSELHSLSNSLEVIRFLIEIESTMANDVRRLKEEYGVELVITSGMKKYIPSDIEIIIGPINPFFNPFYSKKDLAMVLKRVVEKQLNKKFGTDKKMWISNSYWMSDIASKYTKSLTPVLYPPIDEKFFFEGLNIEYRDREHKLVYVGRFNKQKGIDELMELARMLKNTDYIIEIISSTVGENKRYIERFVKQANEYDNIRIRLDVPRDDIPRLISTARFVIFPSYNDAFGMPVAEGMMAGLIPFVRKSGGAWYDIVLPFDKRLGFENINEVPKLIEKIEDSGTGQMISSKARRYSMSNFSYEKYKLKICEVVADFLKRYVSLQHRGVQ